MPNYATLVDNGDGTAYYDYCPDGVITTRRGPMKIGMAQRRVWFLNGVEEPATGGELPDTKRAMIAFEEEF